MPSGEQAQASLPVQVPCKPAKEDNAIVWAKKWRLKFSKQWPVKARTWIVYWCIDHQDIFRFKTLANWGNDVRLAMNLELYRDIALPQRLLGPSGVWVKAHVALRNGRKLRTGTVQVDSDYLEAMDLWTKICSTSTHTNAMTKRAWKEIENDRGDAESDIDIDDGDVETLQGQSTPVPLSRSFSAPDYMQGRLLPSFSHAGQSSSSHMSSVISTERARYGTPEAQDDRVPTGVFQALESLGESMTSAATILGDHIVRAFNASRVDEIDRSDIAQRLSSLEQGQRDLLRGQNDIQSMLRAILDRK